MSKWTEKEIEILKNNYHIKYKDDLCRMLINKNWTAIKDKAFRLKLSYYGDDYDKTRFWKHVDKKLKDECWNWIGYCNKNSYGHIGIKNKMISTHRFSWIIHFGKIPKDLCVLHKCDNKKCVNPNHLFLGTQKDNIHDMINKNRKYSPKREKNGRSKLTENQIKQIRSLKGKFPQAQIGRMFGVGRATIGSIHRNQTWKDIDESKGSSSG